MGFSQALSGLNAASQNLDVIGNNIANAGTVGFKSGSATFADVFSNSNVGLGVQVANIDQSFSAGSLTNTGNQYDIAIDGSSGLFVVQDQNNNTLYTRNGQFHADRDNFIVNAQGQRLMGYDATGNNVVPIKVPVGNLAPLPTSTATFATNLNAGATVINPAVTPFSATDPNSYTYQQSMTIYDSLGTTHQLTQYFAKRAAAGAPPQSQWDVYYRLDGAPIAAPADGAQQLIFDGAGALANVPPTTTLTINAPGGATSPAANMTVILNYAGSTQFGSDFSANFNQNGYSSGGYASMSILPEGSIVANYTNGETQTVGTLALASFNNLQGLRPSGGNAWAQTAQSGQPIMGKPGTNGLATVKGQAVEESNVDISQALVSLIIAQRTYQANAQTIKTQDQVLQALIAGI